MYLYGEIRFLPKYQRVQFQKSVHLMQHLVLV